MRRPSRFQRNWANKILEFWTNKQKNQRDANKEWIYKSRTFGLDLEIIRAKSNQDTINCVFKLVTINYFWMNLWIIFDPQETDFWITCRCQAINQSSQEPFEIERNILNYHIIEQFSYQTSCSIAFVSAAILSRPSSIIVFKKNSIRIETNLPSKWMGFGNGHANLGRQKLF